MSLFHLSIILLSVAARTETIERPEDHQELLAVRRDSGGVNRRERHLFSEADGVLGPDVEVSECLREGAGKASEARSKPS